MGDLRDGNVFDGDFEVRVVVDECVLHFFQVNRDVDFGLMHL